MRRRGRPSSESALATLTWRSGNRPSPKPSDLVAASGFAVDLPGFGGSDRPTRNRISAYAENVQAALAALDVHDFTLVGHSLGGAVATGLTERLRDDVAALVLIAPVGFGRIHLAEAIQLPGSAPWSAVACRWR